MNLFFSYLKRFHLLKLQRVSFRYLSGYVPPPRNKSYFFKNGTVPLTCVTLGEALDHTTDAHGDEIAIISQHQGISKTYLEFRNDVDRLASAFVASGLQCGDRVAIYGPNVYEWPVIQFAAAKAGIVFVTINSLAQALEVEYCLRKVKCKAVVSYDKIKEHDYYEIFKNIFPDLPNSKPGKLQNEKLPALESIIMISDETKNGTIRFKDFLNCANKDSDIKLSKIGKSLKFDDYVNIQYTSGTTDFPKAAILTHHGIINNALITYKRVGFDTMRPNLCCQVPMFHIFGCSIGCLGVVLYGGTCVFPCAGYNSAETLKSIEKYKCNTAFGTPTMFIDLVNTYKTKKTDISSLKKVFIGGSASPDTLLKALSDELKIRDINLGYGLTEASAVLAMMPPETDFETLAKGYIKPLNDVELKVIDRDGHIVPINTEGEVCSRSLMTFIGYWDDEQKTAEAIDKSNWLHSGDIGKMNEDGWLKIVGRIKELVIRGGENISVAEIENFLSFHPSILEVQIVGVPDKRLGEELCCWIKVKPEMTLTEEEVRSFCKGKISNYKIPRYIMFVDDFPKTTTGKIKKYEITRIVKEKLNL